METASFLGLDALQGGKLVVHSTDPVPAWREKARLNANEALRLQPDLPEGHLALGYSYYYYGDRITSALLPNSKSRGAVYQTNPAYFAIGAIQRRQGKWAESTANLEKAATLDPKNAKLLNNLAFSYMALRNFEAVYKAIDGWDPLRNDPRYQALIDKYAANRQREAKVRCEDSLRTEHTANVGRSVRSTTSGVACVGHANWHLSQINSRAVARGAATINRKRVGNSPRTV